MSSLALRRQRIVSLSVLGSLLTLAACGGPSPSEVRERASSILSEMLRETGDAAQSARDLAAVQGFLDGLGVAVPAWGGAAPTTPAGATPKSYGASATQLASALDETLARYIFTDANVESTSGGATTFLLRGAAVCVSSAVTCSAPAGGPAACTPPGTPTKAQEECARTVDQLQVRVVATLVGDGGLDLALTIAGSATVALLELRPGSVTLKLALAAAREAAARVAEALGQRLDLPQVMQGAVALSVVRHAAGDVAVRLAVLEQVKVQGLSAGAAVAVDVAARDPLAEVRLQRGAGTLGATLDYGRVRLEAPARLLWAQAGDRRLVLRAGGGGLRLTISGAGIAIRDAGLVPGEWPTLTLDGQPLVGVLLNPTAAGRFAADLTPQLGLPRWTVMPRLELTLDLQLARIASFAAPPAWARDDRYRLLLEDPGLWPEVVPVRPSGAFPGGLKVLRGSLTVQRTGGGAEAVVVVPTGSCLVVDDQAPAGSHVLLGRLRATSCP